MEWMYNLNWFAIQTKPHQESLAATGVVNLDLEVFLPRCRKEESVCGSLRLVSKALFPGYFFARFCPLFSSDAVRYLPGVLRLVGNSRFPIPVAPEIIDGIRERLHPDGFIVLNRRRFTTGDRVAIEAGPLAGWFGRIESESEGGRRVAVLLETIQHARLLIAERLLGAVEPV
jgi:transcriptional antiterminator RfaH